MEIKLIKSYDIPEEVRKSRMVEYLTMELYTDRLVCKNNSLADKVFFFKHYIDVIWTSASLRNPFAQIVFLTPENATNSFMADRLLGVDANRIAFSSGGFSYKPANQYVSSLCIDIKNALNEFKEHESEFTTATVVQSALSPADELKKFKELLDAGIITQEEFDAKKKELLGL